MLGRQTACMCVSVDSSHENCSYHIQKYSCKFNGIQRPFLFYMNLQVALGGGGVDLYSRSTYIRGRLIIEVDLYSGKYGRSYRLMTVWRTCSKTLLEKYAAHPHPRTHARAHARAHTHTLQSAAHVHFFVAIKVKLVLR